MTYPQGLSVGAPAGLQAHRRGKVRDFTPASGVVCPHYGDRLNDFWIGEPVRGLAHLWLSGG